MSRSLAILGLLLMAAAGPSAAETFELPVELELTAGPVAFDFDHVSLDVALRPGAPSLLTARPHSADEPRLASLEVIADGGGVRVRRVAAGEGAATRLRVELVIDPRWHLQVEGEDLDVTIEAPTAAGRDDDEADEKNAEDEKDDEADDENDEDKDKKGKDDEDEHDADDDDEAGDGEGEPDGEDEGKEPSRQPRDAIAEVGPTLVALKSSLHLIGIQGALVEATDSFLRIDRSTGTLRLTLQGGTAEVEDHQGILELGGRGSEIWLGETKGNIVFTLAGGSLAVRQGIGRCDGQAQDALVQLDAWRGPVTLVGSDATFEAVASTASPFKVSGDGLSVVLEDFRGTLEPSLVGGSFHGRSLAGQVRLDASAGAEVKVDGLRGPATLTLRGGSSARVAGVTGLLQAEVRDASLDASGVQRLQLEASDADLTVSGVQRLVLSKITDSRLDLDLTTIRHGPSFVLDGTSQARVRLKTPCSVHMAGDNGSFAAVHVNGCFLQYENRGRQVSSRLGMDGNASVVLTAKISQDSTLEVEGAP